MSISVMYVLNERSLEIEMFDVENEKQHFLARIKKLINLNLRYMLTPPIGDLHVELYYQASGGMNIFKLQIISK